MKSKFVAMILGIFLIAGIVAISGCTDSGTSSGQSPVNVTHVKAVKGSYGMYDVSGQIVPNKDESYLEAAAIWYDSSGAVIQTSPMLWNVDNAKTGQVYKFKGEDSLYQKGKPAKVEIMIFDSVFSGGDDSDAIYKQNITL